jgi:hypothetical protein
VFWDVPPGTHLLEVTAMGFLYPPIRVDVSAQHAGKASARLLSPPEHAADWQPTQLAIAAGSQPVSAAA